MTACVYCQKKILLKFMMSMCDLKATDIAKAVHVSDSTVRKHIDGIRYCELVDAYLIQRAMGITVEVKLNAN